MRNPFGLPPSATDNDFERYEFTLRNLFQPAKGLHLALGVQAQFEDGRSTSILDFGGFPVPTSFSLTRISGRRSSKCRSL